MTHPTRPTNPTNPPRPTNGTKRAAAGGERIAVLAGLRTPFARQASSYRSVSALDLAKIVVNEIVQRSEIDPKDVDLVVYGQVVPSVHAPNIAREVVLGTSLPKSVQAFSVSRACATSFQAMTSAAEAMLAGQASVAVVGGADSATDVPITVSRRLALALVESTKAKSFAAKLALFKGLSPKDLVPVPPAPKEPSTGFTMGESAEKMAREAGIARADQDAFAHRSHVRAARAWKDGVFDREVMHVHLPPRFDAPVAKDEVVREDGSLEAYAKLKPAFDRKYGSVTAGNSSPLSDGASALVLATESYVDAHGLKPLGWLKSWAYAAVDPGWWMLMGPTFATPLALDRAGLELTHMGVVDMHEAFAAQVLCNRQAFGSTKFAEERLNRTRAVGEIDEERFNVHGGSIALGHPFAATGARMVTTVLHELARRGSQFGLATACAAGGLGVAVVLEAP
ncbi:MAG: acetyl-CoA C-acyltransferase FadI [Polyangiaceae bacterium]